MNVKRQSIHPDIPISNDSCLSENILEESIQETSSLSLKVAKHAMVLAHIASKLTDDQKLGVGAIIVQDLKYTSVAWNGFPKNTEYLGIFFLSYRTFFNQLIFQS